MGVQFGGNEHGDYLVSKLIGRENTQGKSVCLTGEC